MAKRKAAKTARKVKAFSNRTITGTFAYRFSGFSMDDNGNPYRLTGIGIFDLDAGGKLTGSQTSSLTAIKGMGAKHLHASYTLDGTYQIKSDGTGTALIDFTPQTPGSSALKGYFDLMVPGKDKFWFISTKEVLPNGSEADEVVEGEAIRQAF